MVGLLDIAPLTETVEVRGVKLTVTGITGEGLFHLFGQFPEIGKVMADRTDDLSAGDLIKLAPEAVAAAIAAGTGNPGNEQAIAIAKTLSAAEQLELLEVTLRLTFPKGVGPFVETLMRLVKTADVGAADAAIGWGRDTKSPGPSKKSSPSATPQTPSGDIPPGN